MSNDRAEETFQKGLTFLSKDNLEKATRAFEKAHKESNNHPRYMSYFGMCAARRWGAVGMGLELCTRAIKREFYNVEYYINLGKVYMAADNKKGAITVFTKGLRYDPNNNELNDLLIELGFRKRPVIPFLRRSNPLNLVLGIFFRRTIPGIFTSKRKFRPVEEKEEVKEEVKEPTEGEETKQ